MSGSGECKLEGLCIKASPLGENDRLITILTDEQGIVRLAVPGARRPKSSLAAATPLTYLSLQIFGKRNLKSVRQIKILNSYSGIAAAAAGFVVDRQLLIVAGAMVGAAGLILTQVMCKGMNRSLASVLFGGSLSAQSTASSGSGEYTNITSCSVEECALTLEAANKVIIVPGYGLAVAQAQHTLREVTK